jgi:hypothetical protein
MIAAKTRVNPGIYGDDVMIAGGNLEATSVIDVQRIRSLKDMTSKYKILVRQLAIAISFRKWWRFRVAWAEETNVDEFELNLLKAFALKVDTFISALEDYGDSIAKYLLASDEHSRPESLAINRDISNQWLQRFKPQIRTNLKDETGFEAGTDDLKSALVDACDDARQFYESLARLDYASPEVSKAKDYFRNVSTGIVEAALF